MKRILLVDDDAVIRELYRQRLVREGFEVETAADGLEAAKQLDRQAPDLVFLDLMMPRLSGVEVLKFIRSRRALDATPVAIFTSYFLSDVEKTTHGLSVQRVLCKSDCPPEALVTVAKEMLSRAAAPAASSARTDVSPPSPRSDPKPSPRPATGTDSTARARVQFLEDAPAKLAALRALNAEFARSTDAVKRDRRLDDLCRETHSITALAGLAGCHRIALLCGAFETLLFELQFQPDHFSPSVSRTITQTLEFLEVLLGNARSEPAEEPWRAKVLVVDDDRLCNHLAVAALRRAHLEARAIDNPLVALEWLRQDRYDLILLDVEMPGLTGYDVCRRVRETPGYEQTPVIYVTGHSDFENRARGALAGGNDLIAKPVFPIELAVKAVTHLIKSRLPAATAGR